MQALSNLLAGGALSIMAFLIVLSVVVYVHEMGHFLVARWFGVTVTTFSMGFGPELASFVDRYGTRWRFAAIPLGGYVKFLDDSNAASGPGELPADVTPEQAAGAFHTKPVWQRAAVVAAGPLANFILAAVIYALLYAVVGVRTSPARVDMVVAGSPAAAAGIAPGDIITAIDGWTVEGFEDVVRLSTAASGRALLIDFVRDGLPKSVVVTPTTVEQQHEIGVMLKLGDLGIRQSIPPVIGTVLPASPAAAAGFVANDVIVGIDGKAIRSFETLVEVVSASAGKLLSVEVQRSGADLVLQVTPKATRVVGQNGVATEVGRIGLAPRVDIEPKPVGVFEAARLGVREVYGNISQTITGLGDIFHSRQSADQIGGPILMAELSGRVAQQGLEDFLRWIGIISANIGFINLLPIPILDGGHLVFYAIEFIRKKPLSPRLQELCFQVGMVLIIMVMAFVNLNDIGRHAKWFFGG